MRRLLLVSVASAFCLNVSAWDATLRLDYIFSGTDREASISLDGMSSYPVWAGRNVNMDSVPVQGCGQLTMKSVSGEEVLYRTSFSTLFQEWQATEEATRVRRSFENVFLAPMPVEKVQVTVELFDFHGNVSASLTHIVDPSDILIRPVGRHPAQFEYLWQGGSCENCIDIAIVAEGYTEQERESFLNDAGAAMEAIFSHEPFASMKDRFNVLAVPLISEDSGVSIPRMGEWKNTALAACFDTFYTERYLTTLRLRRMHDALAGIPFEHIVILANTGTYGGGGIYNSYTLTTAGHPLFKPVVVHEFGHSFGALADEYYYDDQFVEYYYPDVEPWEKNITTMADFQSKWKSMMGQNGVSLYEGGGYQSTGVWRGAENCRMKSNDVEGFCPVCQEALKDMILFYTEQR
ncbi:MAG: IgA Peptidase M64 [Bacteroidales bacterium]|nr:IgA Peptidase M64 [Bacteroidales bacterium]